MTHQILLYYLYTDIADPQKLMEEQRELCQKLNLKGRIIVAHEGINGTVEGTVEESEQYITAMHADPIFKDMWFKKSEGTGVAFPKLSVKVRPEIVSSYWGKDLKPHQETGKYLSAEELHDWFTSGKEFYVVDMRNDFEHESGHFQNSVLPGLGFFRDLEDEVKNLEHLKDKTVLTVCTGGVRCEKASAFLLHKDFKDVYQLHGGIVTYMEKYPNQHFKGKLYVFDGRVMMGFNTDAPDHEVVGKCTHCQQTCERYINCKNDDCHKHIICCERCETEKKQYCAKCFSRFVNSESKNVDSLVK